MSKQLAEHIGIKTPKWVVASKNYPLAKIPPFPGYYFVKPRFGGALIGIDETCLCRYWDEAIQKAEKFFEEGVEVIVEAFIDGVCFSVPILNTISGEPIIGIPHYQTSANAGGIITYSQKRFASEGMERHISYDEYLNKVLVFLSKQFFIEMQPCDYARIDFIIEKESGIPFFLEVNTMANLGIHSGFVQSFINSHFRAYNDIARHIVELGIAKTKGNVKK